MKKMMDMLNVKEFSYMKPKDLAIGGLEKFLSGFSMPRFPDATLNAFPAAVMSANACAGLVGVSSAGSVVVATLATLAVALSGTGAGEQAARASAGNRIRTIGVFTWVSSISLIRYAAPVHRRPAPLRASSR